MTVADDSSIFRNGHSSGGVAGIGRRQSLVKEWRCGAPSMPRGGDFGGMGEVEKTRNIGSLLWRRRKDERRHSHNRTEFDRLWRENHVCESRDVALPS